MKQLNNEITDTILDYYNKFEEITNGESDSVLLGLKEVMQFEYKELLKHLPLDSLEDFREHLKEILYIALSDYDEVVALNLDIENLDGKDYFNIHLCTVEIQSMATLLETIGEDVEYCIAEMFDKPMNYITIFRSIRESVKKSQ